MKEKIYAKLERFARAHLKREERWAEWEHQTREKAQKLPWWVVLAIGILFGAAAGMILRPFV